MLIDTVQYFLPASESLCGLGEVHHEKHWAPEKIKVIYENDLPFFTQRPQPWVQGVKETEFLYTSFVC